MPEVSVSGDFILGEYSGKPNSAMAAGRQANIQKWVENEIQTEPARTDA
jgi:hypothetical protein